MAEDFEPYRIFIASLLSKKEEVCVACEVSNGLEAVVKARELRPDLVLMDIDLPCFNGIEASRQILGSASESKIIFLTQETDEDVVCEALNLGACGYVVKSQAERELLAAVEAALEGRTFVSSGLNHPNGNEVRLAHSANE